MLFCKVQKQHACISEKHLGAPSLKNLIEGERETMRQKRRPSLVVDIEDDNSYKPEIFHVTKECKERGCPKKLSFKLREVYLGKIWRYHRPRGFPLKQVILCSKISKRWWNVKDMTLSRQ
ncbi:hypothetical protein O6H91_Y252900 [Diphasiastrum complanatum]|nr:hypothetical protein O6H91_Y252900 [Diphasiastrum complanatum]